MEDSVVHSFHIPVMGIGFTIDTPIKVAHFGIASVISIVEDGLMEAMRKYYCYMYQFPFIAISEKQEDCRAKRITAYLNLVHKIVLQNTEALRHQPFEGNTDLVKYFELLPDNSFLKNKYQQMLTTSDAAAKTNLQNELRLAICSGAIDVNIMSKLDKTNFEKDGTPLPKENSDAMAALRGFAHSNLHSSVIFSAGYNPKLYSYIEAFNDFYPDALGNLKKKIILKVSDYRSAITQGKLLAKKGLWVSEFRIESGLNCGGHAFATEGLLLGPILEEFKTNKASLAKELFELCNQGLMAKEKNIFTTMPNLRITVQGGIGTSHENNFLIDYYQTNGTGWGSPFLLVPEATNVDEVTLQQLANANPEDYYLSDVSPLGVPFNHFKNCSSEQQRLQRITDGKPGSPCFRKFLASNVEFTQTPICTASRQYQHLKIKQLQAQDLPTQALERKVHEVTEKACLCTGLSASAFINKGIEPKHHLTSVAICPGPNLKYFSGVFSLQQMVDHIYGRTNLLNSIQRSNMFVNELSMYVDYLKKEIEKNVDAANANKIRYFNTFKTNLLNGVNYYKTLKDSFKEELAGYKQNMEAELNGLEKAIQSLLIPTL